MEEEEGYQAILSNPDTHVWIKAVLYLKVKAIEFRTWWKDSDSKSRDEIPRKLSYSVSDKRIVRHWESTYVGPNSQRCENDQEILEKSIVSIPQI